MIVLCIIPGCKTTEPCTNRSGIGCELQTRLFHDIAPDSCPGEFSIPPTVYLEDGLTEEEAIALALWNNRNFLSTLSNLGIARGDLVQAGLIANPQLNLLFPPIGSKQLEWTVFMPLEAILLRSQRIEVADRDFQRIANELVQNGLNVARDARVAYADFQFAVDRYQLAGEAVEVLQNIADLADKRLAAGDIGELEAMTTRIDVKRNRAEMAGLEQAVQVSEATLKNVLGMAMVETPLMPVGASSAVPTYLAVNELVSEALIIRPDMKAARIAIEAANYRVELARKAFLRIDAVADGNHGGSGPSNVGPGIRVEIPIFNQNQGLIIRSQWTVDQANHNYYAIRDQVVTDVKIAYAGLLQAQANLELLQRDVLPDLRETVSLAEKGYRDGGQDYFLVLQSTGNFITSRIRELELTASMHRAIAELDRSVGRRVVMPVHDSMKIPTPLNNPEINSPNLPEPAPLPLLPVGQSNTNTKNPVINVFVIHSNAGNGSLDPATIASSLQQAAQQMSEGPTTKRSPPEQFVVPANFQLERLAPAF